MPAHDLGRATPDAPGAAAETNGSQPRRVRATSTTRTLLRGLDVVEALADADAGAMGPSAIGDAVGLDKATVSRLLRTLVEAGWVRQDAVTRQYRLSGKILRLAASVRLHLDLRTVAAPHLRALREELGETVHLGVMEDLGVFYVDKLESPNSIQLVSRVGQVMPLHSTSLGKAILAALPEDEREAKIARMDFVPRTDRTITTVAAFRREIDPDAGARLRHRRSGERAARCLRRGGHHRSRGPAGRAPSACRARTTASRTISRTFGERARATAMAVAMDLGASTDEVAGRPGACLDDASLPRWPGSSRRSARHSRRTRTSIRARCGTNLARYAASGIHGYLTLGSNGENRSLSEEERLEVLRRRGAPPRSRPDRHGRGDLRRAARRPSASCRRRRTWGPTSGWSSRPATSASR